MQKKGRGRKVYEELAACGRSSREGRLLYAEHFMDCVAGMMHACVVGGFQSLWIAGGRGRDGIWGNGFAGDFFGFVVFVFLFDALSEREHGLAYRQQRSLGVSINLHNAGCLRVQMRHPVNQKLVSMMPAVHRKTGLPGAVRMPFHSVGLRIPLVEVADDRNTFGLRRRAYKTHRNQSILCRITVSWFPGIFLFFLHIEFVSCD